MSHFLRNKPGVQILMWLCQCGDAACCVLWARILSFTSWTGQKPVNETGLQRNLRAMLVLQTIEKFKKPLQNRWSCSHREELDSFCITVYHLEE